MAKSLDSLRTSALVILPSLAILLLANGCSEPTAKQTASTSPATQSTSGATPATTSAATSSPASSQAAAPTSTASSANPVSTNTTNAVQSGQTTAASDPLAAGKAVFSKTGCVRCHKITGVEFASAPGPGGGFGGPGGRGPGGPAGGFAGGPPGGFGGGGGARAPDLAKVATDEMHTREWLTAYIRNPKSQKPDARMPAFDESKLAEQDLNALVEFLSSLKG